MAGLKEISTVWTNIKEVDLKPIRDSATHPVRLAIVGEPGVGKHTLAEQMRNDPERPGVRTQSPIALFTFDTSIEPPVAHLIIVMVDATQENYLDEQNQVNKWSEAGKNILVIINKIDLTENRIIRDQQQGWQCNRIIIGSVNDIAFLQREFIPAMLELLPRQHLALGRQFPLFRLPIARQLITDTCFSNAAYSFSTGVAQIVPVLDIPLTVTDMIVLTKSQAFLAYKLGLIFGFSTRWQDYVTEFGGVIGGGFIWRQIARQLVGLIPVWGIIPKVAISYSGTYVVGHAILGWYITGRHLTAKQIRALSTQAFTKGRDYARKLAGKLPKPRLGKGRKHKLPAPKKMPELTQGDLIIITESGNSLKQDAAAPTEIVIPATYVPASDPAAGLKQRTLIQKQRQEKKRYFIKRKKKEASELINYRTCIKCGKTSSNDAIFCQYCGSPLDV